MAHTPTDQQCAIIAAVAEPHGHSLLVEAGAGTAKSTTLQMAAPGIRQPFLALAFNRHNAEDLRPRLPANATVKTFNGLGYGALRRALPAVSKWELDDKKLGKLVSEVAHEFKAGLSRDEWDSLRQLASLAMQRGLVPQGIAPSKGLLADTPDSWQMLGDALLLVEDDLARLQPLASEVIRRDISLALTGVISFDDQVYISSCVAGRFPLFPVVVVDEFQDLSPLNYHQLRQGLRPDARLLVVGDRRQGIYAFRGADSWAMETARSLTQRPWHELELSVTFRCPKAVVARQLEHYPNYRAHDSNPEGRFTSLIRSQELAEGWALADLFALQPPAGGSVAVLCRNNAPLFALAFKLLRQGVGVRMLGTDIGKGAAVLLRKIAGGDEALDVAETFARVTAWQTRERSLALANGDEAKADSVSDRAGCLLAVLGISGVRTVGEALLALTRLFEREEALLVLSSIHKAKGLEWDMVLHLDPWRLPGRQARLAAVRGDPIPLEQENNARYVAETRTRHSLVEANLEDFT